MTAAELIDALQAIRPDAPVLIPNDDVGNHPASSSVGYGVCAVETVEFRHDHQVVILR